MPRIGDITLADFWGIGNKIPFYQSKKNGISMISLNTDNGKSLLKSVTSLIGLEKRDLNESEKNINLYNPSEFPKERVSFYHDAFKMDAATLIKKYNIPLFYKRTFIKRFTGRLKRLLKKSINR